MQRSNHSARWSRSGVAGLLLLVSGLVVAGCVPPGSGGGSGPTTTTSTTPPPAHDVIVDCAAGQTCQGTATGTTSNLVVQGTGGGAGQITVDVNEPGALDCSGILAKPAYVPVNPDIYTVDSTTGVAKTITITTTGGKAALAAVPNSGAYSLQVCFASPTKFTSLQKSFPFFGDAKLDPGSGEYVGLLPPCVSTRPLTFAAPCVTDRRIVGNDTKITATLPAGDPRMK